MSVMKTISAPFRLAKWCVVGEKLECVESAKRIGKLLKAEKRVLQQKNFEEVTAGWTLNDFESRRKQAVTACVMQSLFALAAFSLVVLSVFYKHISINQVVIHRLDLKN